MPTTAKKRRKPLDEPVLKVLAVADDQFLALRDKSAVDGILVSIPVAGDGSRTATCYGTETPPTSSMALRKPSRTPLLNSTFSE